MELTATNMSIDILTSLIFALATYRGLIALYVNNLTLRDKLYIGIFTLASLLYVFQTVTQAQTGMVASTTIWNIINGIHAFLAFSIVTLLAKKNENT